MPDATVDAHGAPRFHARVRTILLLAAAAVLTIGCGSDGPVCGDGVVEGTEECDQGVANADDGHCTAACVHARCGDGLVSPSETCDDGNLDGGDACPAA
jgi:cysteine-rich repeat protein